MDKAYVTDTPSKMRYLATRWLILIFGVVLSISCYFYLSEKDYARSFDQVKTQNKQNALAVTSSINNRLIALETLKSLIETQEKITKSDFNNLTQLFLNQYPDILAMEWAARVPDALRRDFEASMQLSDKSDYQILQYESATKMIRSESKPLYLPIQYVASKTNQNSVIGLDISSTPHWQYALKKAQDENTPIVSPVMTTKSGTDNQTHIRIFLPVFDGDSLLKGFLIMVVELDSFIKDALQDFRKSPINTEFYDLNQQSKLPIYTWPSQYSETERVSTNGTVSRETVPFADRQWLVMSRPSHQYLKSQRSEVPRNLLLAGLLLTALAYISLHWSFRVRTKLSEKVNTLEAQLDIEDRALQNKVIEKRILSRALEDSEQRCRDVILLSHGYTWEIDMNDEYTFLSPQAAKIKGIPPKQLAGKNIIKCLIEEDQEKAIEAFKNAHKNQSNIELELRFIGPSGDPVKELIRAVPVIDSLGAATGLRGTGHVLK